MIVDHVEGRFAMVRMTQAEAQVLLDALTAAKIAIGDDLLIDKAARSEGISIDYMRGILAGIAER